MGRVGCVRIPPERVNDGENAGDLSGDVVCEGCHKRGKSSDFCVGGQAGEIGGKVAEIEFFEI